MAMLQPQPRILDTRRPFTRAEARAAGISEKLLISGRFHKVHYDTYVDAAVVITPLVRARSALHVGPPGAYICHISAAELWGLPVPLDGHTHLSMTSRSDRLRRIGIKSHLGQPGAAQTRVNGVPISTPEQTFIDLAAYRLPLVDLVAVGDAMLRARLATIDSLGAALSRWTGCGTRLATRALALVREGVDSPMETRLRLLLVLSGLPEPRTNLILRAEDGTWRMRFDLCYPQYKVLVEYDGRHHNEDMAQWEHDLYRREDLDRLDYRLVVVTSGGLFREPERTLKRVRDALRDRGAKVGTQFRTEWRRHFTD